jgi:hypothetical protein
MDKKVIQIIKVIVVMIIGFIVFKFFVHNKTNLSTKNQFETGVNIHFVEPDIKQVNKIHDAGFTVVRMDLIWDIIEKKKGVYDFSQYDKLVKSMSKNNIKIIFILDYGNPLYDNDSAPFSNNGREAFSNFAKEAVKHYKGKQIMWEIWNEPNSEFWNPKANVKNYYKLAITTINKMRTQDKNTFIVAPALAGFDFSYLKYLGENGLFKYIDAVSVHPYRSTNPETVITDYDKLRNLMNAYSNNKNIQIFSGEWGYPSSGGNMNQIKQAQFCVRQYLINIMCGVNLSVWYDWKNDGDDLNISNDNLGIVDSKLKAKVSYFAVKTMTATLNGFKYIKRINVGSQNDYVLMFKKGNSTVYALWTTGENHNISINFFSSKIKIVEFTGKNYEQNISNDKYNVDLSQSVKYVLN